MAMELCYRYSNYKQKEIGAMFGVDCSAVNQNRVAPKSKTNIKSEIEETI